MIRKGTSICPYCSGELRYYDRVDRTLREKNGRKKIIRLRRKQCKKCGRVHREIPDIIVPFKHYTKDIITGVVEGLITPDTLGFEDYPSEMTMNRWIRKSHHIFIHLVRFNKK